MIIGIDASRANRESKTGTEWYSYNLILELSKIDSQNRYFLYTPNKLKDDLANLPENFQEKVLNWPPRYLWTMIRLSFEMLVSPPDLLFVPAHIIPQIAPKKTVTTIMDVGFLRYPELYTSIELKYHRFGLSQAIKKAVKIITISEFTKKEMVKHCSIDPNRIVVIPLGFSKQIFHPIDSEEQISRVIKKYNIPLNIPYLIYIGRLEKKKNTSGLIKAFNILKKQGFPHKLVLVGKPGFGFEKIKELIKRFHLEDEVITTGWVLEKDLPFLLSGASLFVFPSFYEGFGIPLLEAMACATPIVASKAASIPEVVGEAGLLFDPYQTEEMAEVIKKVISNNNLRDTLVQKGFNRVKEFSWRKCAEKTLEVLKEV